MDDVTRPEVRHSTCFQHVFVQFRALRLGQTTLMHHIDLIILSEAGLNNIDRIVRCQARLAKNSCFYCVSGMFSRLIWTGADA